MEKTFDTKTLIIGFLLGIIFVFVVGAYSGGEANFGIAIPPNGSVLVRSEKRRAYLLNGTTGEAKPVVEPSSVNNHMKLY
ncbi:MAG: hypothetical protein ACYS0I_09800 [Planctomycetota bacterium]|jgi:hypothetical protein